MNHGLPSLKKRALLLWKEPKAQSKKKWDQT